MGELMEYSNEFLARVYGAYMGGEVQWSKIRMSHIYKIESVSRIGVNVYPLKFADCKLLLTPISAITDEDVHGAYEAADISLYVTDFSKDHFVYTFSPNEAAAMNHRYGQVIYYNVIDYLRSKGYDCGYGEIPSLIDAGLAIDKTTLTTNH